MFSPTQKVGKRLMQGEEMPEEGAEEESAAKEKEKKPASEGKAASGKSADRSGQKVSRGNGKREFHGNKRSSGGFRGRRFDDGKNRRSSNPDVIYGRDFDEESVEIARIGEEVGDVVIRGKVQSVDKREIRNERTIFMFTVTDFTDTIGVKIFLKNEEVPELAAAVKPGAFVKLKGRSTVDSFDRELTIMSVMGIKKSSDFRVGRRDTSPVKRVELHCHTKMSDMDGVTDAAKLVRRAYEWGIRPLPLRITVSFRRFPRRTMRWKISTVPIGKKYQEEHPEVTKEELKKDFRSVQGDLWNGGLSGGRPERYRGQQPGAEAGQQLRGVRY